MDDKTNVDISGVDKLELLRELWEERKIPDEPFAWIWDKKPEFWDDSKTVFNPFDACRAISAGRIEYFQHRYIGTDISGDSAHACDYDRKAGIGAFARTVERARTTTHEFPRKCFLNEGLFEPVPGSPSNDPETMCMRCRCALRDHLAPLNSHELFSALEEEKRLQDDLRREIGLT